MADNRELANSILESVGGTANVNFVTHCMTRLRFVLKDFSLADTEKIKSIKGVVGCLESGGQLQIIIGTTVDKVYAEVCEVGGFGKEEEKNSMTEQPAVKEKLTLKTAVDNVLNTLSGCLTPILPVIIGAGLIRMLPALFGPNLLGIWTENSDMYRLLNIVGDAAFYYLPIFIAITASKRFECSTMISILLSCVLLHPDLIKIVDAGKAFHVFGIPMKLTTYSNTIVPTLLVTFVFAYVERFLKKIIPDVLRSVGLPLLSLLIMIPLELCILGPVGAVIGDWIGNSVTFIRSAFGPFGVAVLSATYLLLVATGMHLTLSAVAITIYTSMGHENMVFVALPIAMSICMGLCLGVFIRGKDADTKGLGMSCLLAQALGGVSEPAIYGILLRYKRTMLYTIISGFVGGLYAGITNVAFYTFTSTNILLPICFTNGPAGNFINGCISVLIGFVMTLVLTLVFGIEGKTQKKS